MKPPPPIPVRSRHGATWWVTLFAPVAIVAAIAGAYCNSFPNGFVFDDLGSVLRNPTIRDLRSIGDVLGTAGIQPGQTARGRPLLNLSLAVNYAISGLQPWSYHAFNVMIHALAALLLFDLVRRTLLLPALRERFVRTAGPLAGAIALLWALHPLNTQAVTYIVQRVEAMMALFLLLTLYCLLRGATSRFSPAWYAASVASCLAGAATKEVIAVAPVLAILYDWIFLSGTLRKALRTRWWVYLGLAASWVALYFLVSGARGESAGFHAPISVVGYWGTQLWAISRYLYLAIWPADLTLDYGSEWTTSGWGIVLPGVLVAILLAATAAALWRRPKVGFLAAAFFVVLAPTTIVPVATQTVSEHRMYLPLAAVMTLAVVGVYWLADRAIALGKLRSSTAVACGLALVVVAAAGLGARTYFRNFDYLSELTLWQDTIRKCPDNPRAYNNAAVELVLAKRYDLAMEYFDRAIRLRSDYADALYNRGLCFQRRGQIEAAIVDFSRAVKADPHAPILRLKRAECLQQKGRWRQAIEDYDRASLLESNSASLYYNRGFCWQNLGDLRSAVRDYTRTIALEPAFPLAFNNRGICFTTLGQPREAMADYDQAIALNPTNAEAYNNRGVLKNTLQEYKTAAADFTRAIMINPQYPAAHYNRALSYMKLKEYDQAWADVEQARRLGQEPPPGFLTDLARASGRAP